ncbi:MAG: integration host factor, actinobacterial type [Acidimicrobiia bacterium]|nr:integration host factor, actinobacterial type [Acidimicrobiia bacterium]
MAVPKLTPEQRAAALEKAAAVRRRRAEIKQLLQDGSLQFENVLADADEDDVIGGIKVKSVLVSLPGLGKVKSARLMEELGIAENRRLRGLGRRQREALLDALSG